MTGTHTADPDKKGVLNLYAAFGVGLLLSLVPNMAVSAIAMLFLVGVLVGAYRVRGGAAADSLAENHGTYIIRTIWIATLFSLVLLIASSVYMLTGIDYGPFDPCAQEFAAKGMEFAESATYEQVYAMAQPCMDMFIEVNFRLLSIAALMTALPVLFYLVFRYVKGLSRAIKGYRVLYPKSWV